MTKTAKIIISAISFVLIVAIIVTMSVVLTNKKKVVVATTYRMVTSGGPSAISEGEFIKYDNGTWKCTINTGVTFNVNEMTVQNLEGMWKTNASGNAEITDVTKFEMKEFIFKIEESRMDNLGLSEFKREVIGSIIGEKFCYLGPMYQFTKVGIPSDNVVFIEGYINPYNGRGYEYYLKTQTVALEKNALMDALYSGNNICEIYYGNGYFEVIKKTQVTNISDFKQTEKGLYDVIFTYLPTGETDQTKTKTFAVKIYVAEKDDIGSDFILSNIEDISRLSIGTERKDFIKKITDAKMELEVNSTGTIVLITDEMVSSNWDSSKEGNYVMTLTYGQLSMDFDVVFYDPANIKVESFDFDTDSEIAKGTTQDALKAGYIINFNDGTEINDYKPNGYDFTYKINGVSKTFAEIVKTAGLKTITIDIQKGETYICSTTKILNVYDDGNKLVTSVDWTFLTTLKNGKEGFAVKADGSIDFSGSSLVVYFNGKRGDIGLLVNEQDYVKVNITKDMLKDYRIVNNEIVWEDNSFCLAEYRYNGLLIHELVG